jgi:hypothetical protein
MSLKMKLLLVALVAVLTAHAEKLPKRNANDLYEMLGLTREATHEEIFKAYRRIVMNLAGKDEDGVGLALRAYGIIGREPYRRLYHRVLDEELAERFTTASSQLDLMKGFARSLVFKVGDSMPAEFTNQRYDEEFNEYVVHFLRQKPRAARVENIDGTGNDAPVQARCWSPIVRALKVHVAAAVAASPFFFATGHGGTPYPPPMPWQDGAIHEPGYQPPPPNRSAPKELTPAEKAADQFGRDLDLRLDD